MEEHVADRPRCVPLDYLQQFKSPLTCIEEDYDVMRYAGTGVPPAEHPLNGRIRMVTECGNCRSTNVKVIYAQWSVSVHSGDSYWDCEVRCDDCRKYTLRSFAEN